MSPVEANLQDQATDPPVSTKDTTTVSTTLQGADQQAPLLGRQVHQRDNLPSVMRSSRKTIPNQKYQHLHAKKKNTREYTIQMAHVICRIIDEFNNKHVTEIDAKHGTQFVQTYSLSKAIKLYGDRATEAAKKEMRQLHNRIAFRPVHPEDLTKEELKYAMESLIFLTEKRSGEIKARTCADGSTQRGYISKEESTSPTAATDSVLVTGTIDAKQERDVMTLDVPNAFIQTPILKGRNQRKQIIKLRGAIVDLLLTICPGVYDDFIVTDSKGRKILYTEALQAIYGMMKASILYYEKFTKDIMSIGFKLNPYDVCVANRIVDGKQHTLTWHVDDVKSSHVDPGVNDRFKEWCQKMYGKFGDVKATRGKVHDYLAMTLDYTYKGRLKVLMTEYIEDMADKFPMVLKENVKCPWSENLFKVNLKATKLDHHKKAVFHTFVMKGMFLCKRARPNVSPGICFLSSRVSEPTVQDMIKLIRIIAFLLNTKEDPLVLYADDSQCLFWFVDAAFACHVDMKGHTGTLFTLGKEAIMSDSTKQKSNARSSTESELNGVDEKIKKIIWTLRFIIAQGFKVKINIIFQDNTSTIKLEENGKSSSTKRTRHFDMKLFCITDLINKNLVEIEYCPTELMLADYMTKPQTGKKFHEFRDYVMNLSDRTPPMISRSVLANHTKQED